MNLKLHANATTTPRIRAYIRASTASNNALARELGIHSRTVARWKARDQLFDRSTRPHRLATTLTDWEEALIVELRRRLALPLDDITEAMRRCVNPKLSRSAIHRCLKRHGVAARPARDKAVAGFLERQSLAGALTGRVNRPPHQGPATQPLAGIGLDPSQRWGTSPRIVDEQASPATQLLSSETLMH
jgi:hypothetical protein